MKNRFLFLLSLIFLILPISSFATVYTVTTGEDTDDGICNSQCSLREALGATISGDTILFARQLRGTTIQLTKTLETNGRILIDGPNNRRVTLKGNGTFRIFRTRGIASIDGLIITGGGEPQSEGGGIYNTGTLNMTNCIVTGNQAINGGGIYSYFGTVFINDSTISENVSTAENSTGGIELYRSMIRIINSTISGNVSQSASGGAGGIRFVEPDNWFINGSTIAYNTSKSLVDGSAGGFVPDRGHPGLIDNTILAKNIGFNPDYFGRSESARNSLIGVTDSRSGFYDGYNGCIVGSAEAPVDPRLGALTDNGGSIPTHALLGASGAINAGNNALLIVQNGQQQPADQRKFTRIVDSTVDIGAFEYDSQPLVNVSTITGQLTKANSIRGVAGTLIKFRSASGEGRFAITNPFGFYRFLNVPKKTSFTIECLIHKSGSVSSNEIIAEENTEIVNFSLD